MQKSLVGVVGVFFRFHEKDRVLEKKMSSFGKNSKSISNVQKNFQKLAYFLPERGLFHEIRQHSGRNLGESRFLERKCQVADGFQIGF